MPDRFDCAKLVGALRSRGCLAVAPGYERAGSAPRSPGPCTDPTAGSAVRQLKFESWLYQRVRPVGARKWEAVYACGDLGGDGIRRIRRQTACVGAVGHDQPGQSCEISSGDRKLQGGTVRGRGRCLRGLAAHWPWWMDVVHGLGRPDVPAYRRITPRVEAGSRQAIRCPVPPRRLEGVHFALPVPGNSLPYQRLTRQHLDWRDERDCRWRRAAA